MMMLMYMRFISLLRSESLPFMLGTSKNGMMCGGLVLDPVVAVII